MIVKRQQSIRSRIAKPDRLLIPPALDAIVLACLEKDPEKRPPSAVELERLLANVPLEKAWTNEHAREWWIRHQPVSPSPR